MYPVDVLLEPEILTHVRAKLVLNIPDNALARALENLGRDELRAKSEDEFKAVLKGVFNAPKTRRVIEAILAQSMR
jgi:hypothetical protein